MTLEGTNTYLLGRPDQAEVVVVDPGPDGHKEHLHAVLESVGDRSVAEILVTHRHGDHTGAAKALSARTGAPVRGFDPDQCVAGGQGIVLPLAEGEKILAGGLSIEVLHTPGHTGDSVCLWIPEENALLTGDTVLGRGTTMVDFPDGTLTEYLQTLERLMDYAQARMLPAHGPAHEQLGPVVQRYLEHRHSRLDRVRELVAEHGQDLSPEQLAELMYAGRSPIHPHITHQIAAAQLEHLRSLGEL